MTTPDEFWTDLDDLKGAYEAAQAEVRGYRTDQVYKAVPTLVAELEFLREQAKKHQEVIDALRVHVSDIQSMKQLREWGYALRGEDRLMIRFPDEAAARQDRIQYSPNARLAYQDVTYGPIVFPDKPKRVKR